MLLRNGKNTTRAPIVVSKQYSYKSVEEALKDFNYDIKIEEIHRKDNHILYKINLKQVNRYFIAKLEKETPDEWHIEGDEQLVNAHEAGKFIMKGNRYIKSV